MTPCSRSAVPGPLLALSLWLACMASLSVRAADFPPVDQLPVRTELPDPLVMFDGTPVKSVQDWEAKRRPELKALIQHYMYGYLPEAAAVRAEVGRTNEKALGGKATLKNVRLHFGPPGTPPLPVLVVQPNGRSGPVPVFVAVNFCGNHTALDDPAIDITAAWMRGNCPGCEADKATAKGRGGQSAVWNVEMIIDRGYAIAMYYDGDVDPDRVPADFTDGLHPHWLKAGQKGPGPQEWGTISAWAYGMHRVVDYVSQEPAFDSKRIAAVGHSRLGKTVLLAAALDERIALAIPHQAGCGGTAPSRGQVGESVKQINDRFPHWFNDTFPEFNERVDRLPFDQHALVALCAPRPVLFSNAVEDQWANPNGQFEVLAAASPVYEFLGVEGLGAKSVPATGQLLNSRLGYFIRPGRHSMTTEDWQVFLDFADHHFRTR